MGIQVSILVDVGNLDTSFGYRRYLFAVCMLLTYQSINWVGVLVEDFRSSLGYRAWLGCAVRSSLVGVHVLYHVCPFLCAIPLFRDLSTLVGTWNLLAAIHTTVEKDFSILIPLGQGSLPVR